MELFVQNHSSYPRIGDTAAMVAAQEDAGADIVTDGQVGWADPIAHVMSALDGVRLASPLPYFDSGLSFLQPVITGPIRRRGPILREAFMAARRTAHRVVKPVMPGPYTLARLAAIESGPYRDVPSLAQALSEVLAAEVADLVSAGAELIQVDEPAILAQPDDIRLFRQLLEPLWQARGEGQLMLATYGGDVEPLYAQINSLPADIIALDCSRAPALIDTIAATGASKALALGLVDGRSATIESAETIARRAEKALQRYTLDPIYLVPACGLGGLPSAAARGKLQRLREAGNLVLRGS